MDNMCFRGDTLDGPIWIFDQMGNEVRIVREKLISDGDDLLQHGISRYQLQSAMAAQQVHYDLNAHLVKLEHTLEDLSQKSNLVTSLFNYAEEQLASWASSALAAMTWIFKGFSATDVSQKMEQIFQAAQVKIDQALTQFEEVVALKVAQAKQVREELASSLRISNDEFQHDLQQVKLNTGFADMNIWNLIRKNPDIKSKGVMLGFKGEYWNPELQQQCTLYAAARRTQIGRPLTPNGAWGNAGNWANSAQRSGHLVTKVPEAGDVFCFSGYYGHVGVVEQVLPNGNIIISEANYGFAGKYNIREIPKTTWASWQFIK